METYLVTGGSGFIGANFIEYVFDTHPGKVRVINLDELTYAGNPMNNANVEKEKEYRFVKGSVTDKALLKRLFEEEDIRWVVNFAAESHVDRSIDGADVFVQTNVAGTLALLDAARDSWRLSDERGNREYKEGVKFLQVSTDEVYGSLEEGGLFVEDMPLAPNNPYSASKASADLMVRSYGKTFGLPTNITRCSNNYGPYQFPEKLIPLILYKALDNQNLPIYGDGKQVRDWLYVKDHCSAIDTVLRTGKDGEVYNIGGNNEMQNIELVKLILKEIDKSQDLITYVADRPGHDRRYAIDNTKISTELGWTPALTFEDGIKLTIKWYLEHQEWLDAIADGSYQDFGEKH